MSTRFRKTIKLRKGVNLNLNKKSVGISFGTKGARYSINSDGRKTTTVGVPGTGLYHVSSSGSGKKNQAPNTAQQINGENDVAMTKTHYDMMKIRQKNILEKKRVRINWKKVGIFFAVTFAIGFVNPGIAGVILFGGLIYLCIWSVKGSRKQKEYDKECQENINRDIQTLFEERKSYLEQRLDDETMRHFIDMYWKSGEDSFINKCVNTVLLELQEESPLSVAKIHRDLIAIDFEIFERACKAFYSNQKTATQTIRRVRNSGKVEANNSSISELVQVFRAILYSK